MEIKLHEVAKRYRYEWIFRNIEYRFSAGNHYAVTGPNGSGKSTFLKILSAHLTPSRGTVQFSLQGKPLDNDSVYRHLSFAAPYIELIEELTLSELLVFHQRFKPFAAGLDPAGLIELMQLSRAAGKEIRYFSSGMKQRLKLALAICSHTPLLLLDEPTTNLDRQGIAWYRSLIGTYAAGRLVVVASNVEEDYEFCGERIDMMEYK